MITYARRLCLQYLNSLYLVSEMVLKKGFLDDLSQSTGFAVDQVFENFNTFFYINYSKVFSLDILCLQMLIY